MSLESSITFFLAIFIFGITPGPGIFALLSRSIAFDAKSCWPLALGMALSDVIYLVFACMGLAAIAEHYHSAFTAIRLIGAAYLIYLGWKMWRMPVKTNIEVDNGNNEPKPSLKGAFSRLLQGMLISASNPKVILFYIAFLPSFMDLSALNKGDIILAALLTLSALILGLMLVSYGAERAKLALKSKRAMKRLNQFAGSIMAAAGVYLATRQG